MHLSIVCHRDQYGAWVKLSITMVNSKCCQASTPDGTLLLYTLEIHYSNFFSELLLPPTSHRKARIIHHSVAILPSFSYDHYRFHLHTLMLFHHVGSTIASDSFWLSCPSCKNVWPCGRNQLARIKNKCHSCLSG